MYVSIMNNSYTDLGGLGNTRSTLHFKKYLFIHLFSYIGSSLRLVGSIVVA